jgi:hypothetical protein
MECCAAAPRDPAGVPTLLSRGAPPLLWLCSFFKRRAWAVACSRPLSERSPALANRRRGPVRPWATEVRSVGGGGRIVRRTPDLILGGAAEKTEGRRAPVWARGRGLLSQVREGQRSRRACGEFGHDGQTAVQLVLPFVSAGPPFDVAPTNPSRATRSAALSAAKRHGR